MGLPTKKQLHKHRRGTRKALDTLDALHKDKAQAETLDSIESGESAEPALPKKSGKHANNAAAPASDKDVKREKKRPVQASEKETENEAVIAAADMSQQSAQSTNNDGGSDATEKHPIPAVETMQSVPDPADPPQNAQEKETPVEKRPEDIEKPELSQFADIEEDTQQGRFLSFRIENEDYGIEIKYVTEIIVIQKITEVPHTPGYIKGVINLRGKVIPVMDVRKRFSLAERPYDDRTCIIVVSLSEVAVGLIVDTVNEVVDIPDEMVDPPPSTHGGIESNYISGMGKVGKKVKILLDLEHLLNLT